MRNQVSDPTLDDPFDLQMQDFRIRSSASAPVGYMNVSNEDDLKPLFDMHPGLRLPRRRVERHCRFGTAYFVLALYTHNLPDEFRLEKLACYTDETSNRFKINIGFIDSERQTDQLGKNAWNQRLVVVRSEMPIPAAFDVFMHHDNIIAPEIKMSPASNMSQVYPLQAANYIERSAAPLRKLSEGGCRRLAAKPAR